MTSPSPILFLNLFSGIGGAERSLLSLIRHLDRRRWSPVLVCPRKGELSAAAAALHCPVRFLPLPDGLDRLGVYSHLSAFPRFLGMTARLPTFLARLRSVVREVGAVLVHANGAKAHAVSGLALAARLPVIWHWRDLSTSGPRRTLLRLLSRRVRAHVANSRAVAASLASFGDGVRCIYNPIDVEEFRPGLPPPEDEAFPPFEEDDEVLGLFSILAPAKGILESVEAFAALAAERPRARLLVVGDVIYVTAGHAGYRDDVARRARELGVDDRVHFVGFRNDVARCMAAVDVCLHLPTRPEPFGRVVAEAMACGLPVVAADEGGIPEIIRGPEEGCLVPPRNGEAAARAIAELLASPSRRRELGRRAREVVVERFAPRRHVEAMEALYDEILGKRPATS